MFIIYLNCSEYNIHNLRLPCDYNKIISGLCGEGEAGKLVDNGDNTYGGKYVVNPSGGLISKGHPLGATG